MENEPSLVAVMGRSLYAGFAVLGWNGGGLYSSNG
jgi:hypothetical protein